MENHHEDSILAAVHVEHLGLLFSVDESGVIRAWHSSSALSHPKSGPKGVRSVPPRVGVMSMAFLARAGMLAIGSDDYKIRFFDAASLRHDLTFSCEGSWPVAMTDFQLRLPEAPLAEHKEAAEGLAWGDSAGVLHAMPAAQIADLRTQNEVRRRSGGGAWRAPTGARAAIMREAGGRAAGSVAGTSLARSRHVPGCLAGDPGWGQWAARPR